MGKAIQIENFSLLYELDTYEGGDQKISRPFKKIKKAVELILNLPITFRRQNGFV